MNMKRYFNMSTKCAFYLTAVMMLSFASCKKAQTSPADQALEQDIESATKLESSAIEGTALGDPAPGSKAQLQTTIDWATFIKQTSGNSVAYTNAKATLDSAVKVFKNNVVKPGTPYFVINSFFTLGSVDDLVPNKTGFTIETQAKLTDLNTDGTAKLGGFITFDDKNEGILFRYTNTGAVAAYIYNGGYIGATTPANTLVVGQWVHLTYTFDGTNIIIYVDGVKKASTVVSGGPKPALITAGSPGVLGMSRNNVWTPTDLRSMHGNLKDVRFWNRPLSPTEVTTYMGKTLTGTESGPVAYWPFDLNVGTNVPSTAGKFTAAGTNITWQ
jgi:hypothetical protein